MQTHRTPGITSRPDDMELNRQDLNTPDNKHNHKHTPGIELTNNDMKRGQETNHIRKQEAGTQDTHDRGLTNTGCSIMLISTFLKQNK